MLFMTWRILQAFKLFSLRGVEKCYAILLSYHTCTCFADIRWYMFATLVLPLGNTLIQCVRVDCRQPSNYRSCCKWKVPFLRYPIGYSNFLITHWNLFDKTPLDPSNRFDTIHRWSEVTESMVIKLSPFCGYNMPMCGGNERRFIALFK